MVVLSIVIGLLVASGLGEQVAAQQTSLERDSSHKTFF